MIGGVYVWFGDDLLDFGFVDCSCFNSVVVGASLCVVWVGDAVWFVCLLIACLLAFGWII